MLREHALAHGVAHDPHDDDADTLVRQRPMSSLALIGETSRPDPAERRAARRIPIEIDVMVHSADHLFHATTADISSGGMFLETFRDVPVGAHVVVDFKLPSGVELEIEGSVRWRRHGAGGAAGIAVAFDAERLDSATHHVLESFCEVRAPLYCDVAC